MLHPTDVSSVVLHAHWLWIYFPAPQLWEISVFFKTSQKSLYSLTQSWAISQRQLYYQETPRTSGSCYCAQINLTQVHISRAKRFFYFTQTNEKSLKPCSAGEKCFITQLYIHGWWSGTWKQSENIYALNWITSEVSQCRTVIRKAVISSSLTHETINSRSLSE